MSILYHIPLALSNLCGVSLKNSKPFCEEPDDNGEQLSMFGETKPDFQKENEHTTSSQIETKLPEDIRPETAVSENENSIDKSSAQAAAPENADKADTENHGGFSITDEKLGAGSAREKFKANIEAIKTLKQVESDNRTATAEEKEKMSKYVGWGGVQEAFDPDNNPNPQSSRNK